MTKEKLVFGQFPSEEAEFRRRSEAARRKQPPNQEVYDVYRVLPLVEKAIKVDQKQWQQARKERRRQQRELMEAIWGKEVEIPRYISPSTASFCLRWVGYEALGYKPVPPTTKANLAMMMGSASHWSLLRKLGQQIPGGRQETRFTIDEADLSGRVDFLFKNPLTDEYQIGELKFVGDYPFRQIKRQGLPGWLRSTKKIYPPLPEHRHQVLLYIWAKRKQGLDVTCANIVYINRSNGERKEALVLWDPVAKYDAEQLVDKIKKAKVEIDEGELPEPSVESTHVCARFCPYRKYCEHGQKFAAGQVRREKKRKPRWVYRQAREERAARREKMEKLGLVQAELPGLEKETPVCGDCGGPMKWNPKAARGGRYVCPRCGND